VNDQNWSLPADQQVTYALNAKTQADGWRESAEEHKADAVEARGDADAALETYPTPPAPDAATHAYGEGAAGLCQGDALVEGGDDARAEGEAELADARGLERPGSYEACFQVAARARGYFLAAAAEYAQADVAYQGAAGQFRTCVSVLGGGGVD
jgi:hypothetical protein